jgi:hypothetical protein
MRFILQPIAVLMFVTVAQAADPPSAADIEFFEAKIRPVLTKNCYGCHGGDLKSPMAGLFLDSRGGILTGGKSGPAIVPGNADASLLIRAVRYQGPKMPPSGPLPEAVVADLVKWVGMGAPDPRVAKPSPNAYSTIDIDKGRKYWAFQAPVKPATPKVKNGAWAAAGTAGNIDRLVLAKMEKEHVTPVADADRTTWIRRVTLDLTGLPPTPDEIDAFLADRSKTADAKVVDRLLASPRFGERWGRHWLDVARYADTVGRTRNYAFPVAWRYRDWVIDALNSDMPYDEFVREQVAGDLMPSSSAAQHNKQLTATGFLAMGAVDLMEQNPAVFAMDAADEKIDTTSRAFMGLTVGCARCHDHKFDPIPTADYYAMAGIFRSTETLSGLQRRPRDNVSYFKVDLLAKLSPLPGETPYEFLPDPAQRAQYDKLQADLAALTQTRRPQQKGGAQKGALAKGGAQQGGVQQGGAQNAQNAQQQLRQQATQILAQLDRFPLPDDVVMGVRDAGYPADSEIFGQGEVTNPGPKVPRGFLQVISQPGQTSGIKPGESGRLELAQWLTRPENPVTARVAVNRMWEHLFGRGIVATADNFGKTGTAPSNQPLLDYLAVRFVQQGWSTKRLVREIVLSRTYRLSTAPSTRNEKVDPDNVYLWRANRQRLEAEPIRDSLLMIAGQLDLNKPATPASLNFRRSAPVGGGRGGPAPDYTETMRNRTVYLPVVRNYLPNLYETFDFPESTEVKSVRDVTTVPTQALFLMNSRFVIDQARSAATRLLAENLPTPQERVTRVYREVLGRLPTPAEVERALVFIHSAQETAESQPAEPDPAPVQGRGRGRGGFGGGFPGGGRGASGGRGGRGVIGAQAGAFAQGGRGRGGRGGPVEAPLGRVSPEESAWEHFYQALFAGAEFRYRG